LWSQQLALTISETNGLHLLSRNIIYFYGTRHHPNKVLLLYQIRTRDQNITIFYYDDMYISKYNKLLRNERV
jgi:hypothetical protein